MILVIGYGNPLCGDDGIGPFVVERLATEELRSDVEFEFRRLRSSLILSNCSNWQAASLFRGCSNRRQRKPQRKRRKATTSHMQMKLRGSFLRRASLRLQCFFRNDAQAQAWVLKCSCMRENAWRFFNTAASRSSPTPGALPSPRSRSVLIQR